MKVIPKTCHDVVNSKLDIYLIIIQNGFPGKELECSTHFFKQYFIYIATVILLVENTTDQQKVTDKVVSSTPHHEQDLNSQL